jgi:hypothetical protein
MSYDGGVTWSSFANFVDATSSGANPTYTIGGMSMAANPMNGSIALIYSLLNGSTASGVYLQEFQ